MKPRQRVNNFTARRPFYRSIVLPVDHFIAPNGRFIKANKRFYQAKAARRPFYRFIKAKNSFIKPMVSVDHFIARRPFYRPNGRSI